MGLAGQFCMAPEGLVAETLLGHRHEETSASSWPAPEQQTVGRMEAGLRV